MAVLVEIVRRTKVAALIATHNLELARQHGPYPAGSRMVW